MKLNEEKRAFQIDVEMDDFWWRVLKQICGNNRFENMFVTSESYINFNNNPSGKYLFRVGNKLNFESIL